MNLLLRLLWLFIASRMRSAVSPLGPCRTPFRVWPTDLDVLRHVNNGIYLSIMDLARVDLMMRSGFAAKVKRQGWFPVVVAETIQFRRSLMLFQRFDIETRVIGWDDKAIIVEQQFFCRGESVAHALVRARFLSRRGGSVTPRELVALLGLPAESPAMGDYAARWNAEQADWKGSKP
ncbi:MAG TPA: acyl-CoA thioesterase [Steroidobacteraceae bacterium]|nr:acyl-CoA thioesterase [Steroidobacteraceae bacterium]